MTTKLQSEHWIILITTVNTTGELGWQQIMTKALLYRQIIMRKKNEKKTEPKEIKVET